MPVPAEPPAAVARRSPPGARAPRRAARPEAGPSPIGAGRAILRGVTWGEYVALREKPENVRLPPAGAPA